MLGSLQAAEDVTHETLLHRRRRTLPALIGVASSVFVPSEPMPADTPWLEPFPDAWFEPVDSEPGAAARRARLVGARRG